MTDISIVCVIPAKDEAELLPLVIPPIIKQGAHVIVVNDSSSDDTVGAATRSGADVVDCDLHNCGGRLHISEVVNTGLRYAMLHDPEYIFICGADDIVCDNYITYIINMMRDNDDIVVAAGSIYGQRKRPRNPQGVRVVRVSWWRRYGVRYETCPGWETKLFLRARSDGFLTESYGDIYSTCLRPLGTNTDWVQRGRATRNLGYGLTGLLYRMFVYRYHPRRNFQYLKGFLLERSRPEKWLVEYHRDRHYIWNFLRRRSVPWLVI